MKIIQSYTLLKVWEGCDFILTTRAEASTSTKQQIPIQEKKFLYQTVGLKHRHLIRQRKPYYQYTQLYTLYTMIRAAFRWCMICTYVPLSAYYFQASTGHRPKSQDPFRPDFVARIDFVVILQETQPQNEALNLRKCSERWAWTTKLNYRAIMTIDWTDKLLSMKYPLVDRPLTVNFSHYL